MLTKEILIEFLSKPDLPRREAILAVIATEDDKPKSTKQIRDLASECGIRSIDKWNISEILNRSKGLTTRLKNGWVLTEVGKDAVSKMIPKQASNVRSISQILKASLDTVEDPITNAFLSEAAFCFENKCYRAAVVLSWVGAVSIMQDFIERNHIDAFNSEASRRNPKWTLAKTKNDFSRMKEKEFLEILVAISVLGKNVKQELEQCLVLRNSCGHPNSLKLGQNRVASHIEILILNVYNKF